MKQLAGRGGGFFVGGKRMRGFGLGPPGEISHWGPPGRGGRWTSLDASFARCFAIF